MAEKHLKKWSAYSVIREIQIKTILRFYLTPVRMAKIKNSGNSSCCWGCGERETLFQCWWHCKLVHRLWKSVWWFLRKLEIALPEDPVIPLLGIYPKDVLPYHKNTSSTMFILINNSLIYNSLIYNSQKLETTQMSLNWRMDTENVIHVHNGILLSY